MGQLYTKLFRILFSCRTPLRIVMIGLDGSGKTTILYKLKLGEVVQTIPTIGFNVESIEYKNMSFTVWDIGGQSRIRSLWNHYFQNTQAIIYVIDSTDIERMEEASEEIKKLLDHELLTHCSMLFLCNKQDMDGALSMAEISERLKLNTIKNRKWYLQPTVATEGSGLYEGLDWLINTLIY